MLDIVSYQISEQSSHHIYNLMNILNIPHQGLYQHQEMIDARALSRIHEDLKLPHRRLMTDHFPHIVLSGSQLHVDITGEGPQIQVSLKNTYVKKACLETPGGGKDSEEKRVPPLLFCIFSLVFIPKYLSSWY